MRRPPLPFQAGVGDDREPSGPTSCRLTPLPPGSRWTCRVSASISDTVSPLSRLGPPRVTAFSSESHPSEWSAPEATPPRRSAPRKSPTPAPVPSVSRVPSPGFCAALRSVSGEPSLSPPWRRSCAVGLSWPPVASSSAPGE